MEVNCFLYIIYKLCKVVLAFVGFIYDLNEILDLSFFFE